LKTAIPLKEEVFVTESVTYAVSINGKRRTEVAVPAEASKEEIVAFAKEAGAKWLEGMSIVKEIVVPGKLVNFVVKPSQ